MHTQMLDLQMPEIKNPFGGMKMPGMFGDDGADAEASADSLREKLRAKRAAKKV